MSDFYLVSKGPDRPESNGKPGEELTIEMIYGRLTRRQLAKPWYDHNNYELQAIFDDLNEEMKEQIRLHGGEIEEPKKLNKMGIAEITGYFNKYS